jgi:hypothetical protein
MNEAFKVGQISNQPRRQRWPDSRVLASIEFGAIILIFWADVHHHIFLNKTLYLLPLAWVSLRVRGLRWQDVGFVPYRNWRKTLLVGASCGVAMECFELFVSQPLFMRWTGRPPDLELFRALRGNIKWTLIAVVGSWTLAAFGEEMVYRGYLMNRVAGLFRQTQPAWIISLIVVSCVFGGAHLGQGITGQLENLLDGLMLGGVYLACGRSLAVPILAHGITDTLDVLLMFAGLYPTHR